MKTIPTTVGELFTIGRRIEYTGDAANARGTGAIVAVEQADQWGGPYVLIVLEDGREFPRTDVRRLRHHSERNGCTHRLLILDGYADTMDIAELTAAVAMKKANESARKQEAALAHANEIERIKAEHPELEVGAGNKVAAANCRKLLKAAFAGIKFSVRSGRATHASTLDVRWTDGPTRKQVEEIAERFSAGSFDGMDDCYKFERSAWAETFGSAMYVSCQRDYSDDLVARAIAAVVAQYGGAEDAPTVEDYRNGRAWGKSPILNASNHDDWQSLIGRACAEMKG